MRYPSLYRLENDNDSMNTLKEQSQIFFKPLFTEVRGRGILRSPNAGFCIALPP
jgi:hypothetical protein